MKRIFCVFAVVVMCAVFAGCARLKEIPKMLWGSSTLALEDARIDAVSRIYECSYNDCFNKILEIAKEVKEVKVKKDEEDQTAEEGDEAEKVEKVVTDQFHIFIQDRKRSLIVLMNIPNCINTTEVGVFFLSFGENTTKVEISSLSPDARDRAADIIFPSLKKAFREFK